MKNRPPKINRYVVPTLPVLGRIAELEAIFVTGVVGMIGDELGNVIGEGVITGKGLFVLYGPAVFVAVAALTSTVNVCVLVTNLPVCGSTYETVTVCLPGAKF